MIRITALMDNKGSEHLALIHEHGLSYYIEYNGTHLLFDCGSGPHSQDNAHRLGIDLKDLDAVVLSHSHYDHAAGYRDLIENGQGSKKLFIGDHFFEKKYAKAESRYTDLSAGFDEAFLHAHGIEQHVVAGHDEIFPGVHVVTAFPRVNAFETIPERFVRLTPGGFVSDDFCDEICLALQASEGLIVLVGCAHPGILNMVQHVQEVLNQPVIAVYGGTHLKEASDERIETTISELKTLGVETLGLSHCSGDNCEVLLHAHEEVTSLHLGTGDTVFHM